MNLKEWKESGLQLIKALRVRGEEEAFRRLLSDLYPDSAHFIYELFQNAEDAKAGLCRFTLSDSSLEFEHSGTRLFSEEDVKSITSFGNSTKRDDPTSIGKFGVGFKAVFAYTNTPEIHSGDFHFRIHDLVVPETEGVTRPKMGDQETRFAFPFDNPKKLPGKAVGEVECGLRALGNNTLLFLSHIRKIEYLLPDGSLGTLDRIEHQDGHIEIRASQPGGEETISHWLLFDKDVEVTDEDGKLKTCRIAIAYSLAKEDRKNKQSKWKIVPLDRGQVSIYFPAEKETSNLRFHIHAPFASIVARDSVRGCPANEELRDHLKNLAVESLASIRDRGMLDVSFLAVLPNPADNLPNFYEPIREAIVEAFCEQDLTPTRSGEHKPSEELYRGPARIAEVLGDEGISILTNYASSLWATNAPQENQREDRFLQSLKIDEWGWSELASSFKPLHPYTWQDNEKAENAAHKEQIEIFVREMSDAELMRFYALLGETVDAHDESIDIDDLRIVRVTKDHGNNHVTPKEAYFHPEGEAVPPSDVILVKPEVYSIGRSDPQKKFAASFLKTIGVRPYDAKAGIERILGEYRIGHVPTPKTHISHIRQFVGHWLDNPNSIEMFEPIAFLIGEGKNGAKAYCEASNLYLDSPYIETGLAALFNDNKLSAYISKPKKRLSPDYLGIKKFKEFVVALGAMTQLEISPYKATEMQKDFFEKAGRESSSTTDEDYFINGFHWYHEDSDGFIGEFSLDCCKSMALSRAIWKVMCGADPRVLTACYVPNQKNQHKEKSKTSWLVDYLAKRSWVPDKAGNFLRPTEITDKTLQPDFKFDNRNGWLTAIRFGEDDRKQSEEYCTKNQEAQKLGLPSAEVAEEIAALLKSGVSIDEIRALKPNRKIDLPDKISPKPEERAKKIANEVCTTHAKTTEARSRAVKPDYTQAQRDARTYLKSQCKYDDGMMFCQLCQKPQPVMLNGEPYFEAVDCISDLQKEIRYNNLALCPNHAAMYKSSDLSSEIVQRAILERKGQRISLNLAGNEVELYFTQQHLGDLRAALLALNSEEK